MIKVLIVEDEMPSARKLKAFIEQIAPDFEILDILDSVEQTVQFLSDYTVDLIFLDIQLSDGISFSIFDKIKVETPIIFTTAFNQYAIEAFEQVSVDYLLKPLVKDRLIQAIEKFRKIYLPQEPDTQAINYQLLNTLLAEAKQNRDYQERFMVHFRDKIKTILVGEIAAFYAENRSVFILTYDGHYYDISYTLEQLEERINPRIFFRANRKCIVHINAVKEAIVYSKSKLKLHLQPGLPFDVIISSEKTPKFKKWLSQ
ncbi:LytR/AlgR family response regulator transcription factor [Plebeiibacterium marinum]|uniref:LytTR family DNA-binding domain-containing protein n=1 Tax=Plebeiibacterium marinum TaxID=2992111 RepID=A0AAE3SKE9_9BACT|nr:LytTR family DNA-binding domain-containing protein [Plebeiobacterium marinum]MCW3805435.1 LytTR family DNA-binding domain-containing protein [Plebeiobacterium marinum]